MPNSRPNKPYPPEMRERSVRLVLQHRNEYPSQRVAILTVSEELGIAYETLRRWVRHAQSQERQLPDVSTDDHERVMKLEKENQELRRANEVLKSAAAFFGAALGQRPDN